VTTRPTVRSVNGLVATDHHLATTAGLEVLRDGGSAVDAAVAAAAVCTVTQPHRTGIGGDLFALVYDASTREVTPEMVSADAQRVLDLIRQIQAMEQRIETIAAGSEIAAAAAARCSCSRAS